MTREEAVEVLKERYLTCVGIGLDNHANRVNEAIDMAIEALSEPSGDLISRADAIDGDLISRKVLMDRLELFCKWCKDGRLQGAEFVWDCIVPNVPSADAIHSVGVFVPNMEMPKVCDYCLFHDSGWSWCKAKDKYCGDDKCPLIAVRG